MVCFRKLILQIPFLGFGVFLGVAGVFGAGPQRRVTSLDGAWEFRRSDSKSAWKQIVVPNPFESHEGLEFDGRGTYRKRVSRPEVRDGRRVLLHFEGVATFAQVRVDGKVVGEHLGGWTPFRCDITEAVRASREQEMVVEVDVDERVGHNSQGFLPVFAPHFGGIWQSVRFVDLPEFSIDDRYVRAVGDVAAKSLRFDVPLVGLASPTDVAVNIRYRLTGVSTWSPWWLQQLEVRQYDRATGEYSLGLRYFVRCDVPVEAMQTWAPDSPRLYDIEIRVGFWDGSRMVYDQIGTRAAFRTIEAAGDTLRLNGRPLRVRGILNWGYAPPGNAPSLDEGHFRREVELARSFGFNTMKFCLWVPPRRYLELCDELGMLAWVEYPTWHSKWTADQEPTLRREFAEFFAYDRNHPSVVLRSLTCETGPQADLQVISSLYRQCHAMIPGAVVEDDSSWIQWNRVHDFYDDHPYGNNHTWVATLERLKAYIAAREPKPLVLGECMAADTWVSPSRWRRELAQEPQPFWLPRFLEDNARWLDDVRTVSPGTRESQLAADARSYALRMRKYQIETFHREVPRGGYVVSVIRDIPLCSMGLIDYGGRPKWKAGEWAWHGDRMILLETPGDCRSFAGGQTVQWRVWATNDGPVFVGSTRWRMAATMNGKELETAVSPERMVTLAPGARVAAKCELKLPNVARPSELRVRVEWLAHDGGARIAENEWRLWVFPRVSKMADSYVVLHDSVQGELRRQLEGIASVEESSDDHADDRVIVARKLTPPLWQAVRQGGKLLLIPDGSSGSVPLEDVWWLRGGPWVVEHSLPEKAMLGAMPRQALVDLQAFDLAGPVVPEPSYWKEVRPWLMLWHNHDLDRVQTHGVLFDTVVGSGRMFVSAVRHVGAENAAGRWLLAAIVDELARGEPPRQSLRGATVQQIADELGERRLDLSRGGWRFRVDGGDRGMEAGWTKLETWPRGSWEEIEVGRAWEAQGHARLDGWAWYGRELRLPDDWPAGEAYLVFHGVDDYYEVYVNGKRVGGGGDIKLKKTAFDERASFRLAPVRAGETIRVVVRVYDWYGAGGIHRPVWLSTTPLRGQRVLK